MDELKHATARRASPLATFKAVAAAFFGVRGGRAHGADVAKLNPLHVVIVGVIMAILFILTLVTIVRIVLS
jgi:Protein of unknown function (DUF2970)